MILRKRCPPVDVLYLVGRMDTTDGATAPAARRRQDDSVTTTAPTITSRNISGLGQGEDEVAGGRTGHQRVGGTPPWKGFTLTDGTWRVSRNDI